MRIRCFGYIDEQLVSLERLVDIMREIEVGNIERSEIEIVDDGSEDGEQAKGDGGLFCIDILIGA